VTPWHDGRVPDLDDDLIARLRDRAADPERRTDAPRSMTFSTPGGSMRTEFADLESILSSGRSGGTAVPGARDSLVGELPGAASPAAIDAAGRELPFRIPRGLRRVWTEVANGGFGPGGGLLSVEQSVAAYQRLSAGDELPRGRAWRGQLLPIRDNEPGFECLDVASGQVVAWDPEGLAERVNDRRWERSFEATAPTFAAWWTRWLDARPASEVLQERINASMIEQARAARASIRAKTPEERRAMGLPDVGWEKVVWGGLGLEADDGAE
jgi:SMI1/KNR4 family protein SUKH-1